MSPGAPINDAAALDIRIDRKSFEMPDTAEMRVAIEDLDLAVPARQFLCIVGPSGCGKTTLMNIIAGLDREVDGQVRFANGKAIGDLRLSYMFQTPRLLPWLTVLDNVKVVLGDRPDNGKAEALLVKMGLGDSLNYFPNRLSGGMQRRVALARAFVTEPQLLLLDEPFVSLDVPVGNTLRGILLDLWRDRPTTVVFVTHDLGEAVYLADRMVFLSQAPSRVILDVEVSLPRPRQADDPVIDDFRRQLLRDNQSLLHGLASSPDPASSAADADHHQGLTDNG